MIGKNTNLTAALHEKLWCKEVEKKTIFELCLSKAI